MTRIPITIILAIFLLCLPAITYADGGIFIREAIAMKGYEPSQSAQQAIMIWNLWGDNIETLHLQSNYSGPAEDFAWVIPVPSRPKVRPASWLLFQDAEQFTRPQVRLVRYVSKPELGCGCSVPFARSGSAVETGVTKLESIEIDELHVDVLSAKDGGGLLYWLRMNGYAVPQKAEPILQEYITRDFFFIAVKIRKESLKAFTEGDEQSITTGLNPLAITFKTDIPFSPLKISSLTSAPENELLLLIVGQHRFSPVEYPSISLSKEDVMRTFGPTLVTAKKDTIIDFGPAVKEAQKRAGENALVLEAVLPMLYDKTWLQGRLWSLGVIRLWEHNSPELIESSEEVYVTRFHAFLTPEDMRDITFARAKNDHYFFSHFDIYEHELQAVYVPISLILAGTGFTAFARRGCSHSRFRKLGFALFLLALCLA